MKKRLCKRHTRSGHIRRGQCELAGYSYENFWVAGGASGLTYRGVLFLSLFWPVPEDFCLPNLLLLLCEVAFLLALPCHVAMFVTPKVFLLEKSYNIFRKSQENFSAASIPCC